MSLEEDWDFDEDDFEFDEDEYEFKQEGWDFDCFVNNCARCGEDHFILTRKFNHQPHPDIAIETYGFCENTGEPVFQSISYEEELEYV